MRWHFFGSFYEKSGPFTKTIIIIAYIAIMGLLLFGIYKEVNKICYQVKSIRYRNSDALYLVIDLSGGPAAQQYPFHLTQVPPDISKDTCRTTELWLRLIPKGTFLMGSPENELGRHADETQHKVTLTRDYYISIFPCTQKQYMLLMGNDPSSTYKGDEHPVDSSSYLHLRGEDRGTQWPATTEVDENSFFGRLRAKTGLTLDLPTEAQWEFACRAGTSTALNSGKNLTDRRKCPNLDELGMYEFNTNGRHTRVWFDSPEESDPFYGACAHSRVGVYRPNAWGIYDCHGNVFEWCLDRYGNYPKEDVIDPVGATTGEERVLRGGTYRLEASMCRSASRSQAKCLIGDKNDKNNIDVTGITGMEGEVGFRIVADSFELE